MRILTEMGLALGYSLDESISSEHLGRAELCENSRFWLTGLEGDQYEEERPEYKMKIIATAKANHQGSLN